MESMNVYGVVSGSKSEAVRTWGVGVLRTRIGGTLQNFVGSELGGTKTQKGGWGYTISPVVVTRKDDDCRSQGSVGICQQLLGDCLQYK
eukprot:751960-Hanusia_phi.AAC.1